MSGRSSRARRSSHETLTLPSVVLSGGGAGRRRAGRAPNAEEGAPARPTFAPRAPPMPQGGGVTLTRPRPDRSSAVSLAVVPAAQLPVLRLGRRRAQSVHGPTNHRALTAVLNLSEPRQLRPLRLTEPDRQGGLLRCHSDIVIIKILHIKILDGSSIESRCVTKQSGRIRADPGN